MTTPEDRAEALDAVRDAQGRWERERESADERRRQAIVHALSQGLTLTEIGEVMGLSRGRVSQIRDGKR